MTGNPTIPANPTILAGGAFTLYPQVLEDPIRTMMLMRTGITWRQEQITIQGRQINLPRLTAVYAEAGVPPYAYSGIQTPALPWTPELRALRRIAEEYAQAEFNTVLLNWYRDGQDSLSWHSDDEGSLGPRPVIASLSLGEPRPFRVRPVPGKPGTLEPFELMLGGGNLLIMKDHSQSDYQHHVPKIRNRQVGERINLTFRKTIHKNPNPAWT